MVWPSGSLIDFWIGADSEAAEDAKASAVALAATSGQEDKADEVVHA